MMIYVSAVMPTTKARVPFLKQSIECFLAQDCRDVELVINTHGFCPEVKEAVGDHRHIRYTYRIAGDTIGAARNFVNHIANGQVIIHWDDDDWYAPERISDEVGFLISSGKSVVGYHDLLYYRETDGSLFKYRCATSKDMPYYAAGTTQCYWRNYWLTNQFHELNRGEDSLFSIKACGQNQLVSKDSLGMVVARAHAGNAKLDFGSAKFPPAAAEEFPEAFLKTVRK